MTLPIYKTMEEMKPFPRLACLCMWLSVVATQVVATQVVASQIVDSLLIRH